MANRITTLFDLDSKGFDGGLKKLRKSVADADGAINKLKVAGAGLKGIALDNIGALAAGAGAALVAFGVKSVQAFQETALAARDFSNATGVAVEDASRLIEVAGDYGIEAGAVQGAVQKMNKAIADGKPVFDQYGVTIARTQDGLVDANATFINAITTIGKIADPTARAQAAQQAFGKSYGEVARFMEMSSEELRSALADVSDQQAITDEESERAEAFALAMDGLQDSLKGVSLEVGGQLVPLLTSLAAAFELVQAGMVKLNDLMPDEDSFLGKLINEAEKLVNPFTRVAELAEDVAEKLGVNSDEYDDVAAKAEYYRARLRGVAAEQARLAMSAGYTAEQLAAVGKALAESDNEFTDQLDSATKLRDGYLGTVDSLGQLQETMTGDSGFIKQQQAINSTTKDLLDYIGLLGDVPQSTITEILTALNKGDYDEVLAAINALAATRTISFRPRLIVGGEKDDYAAAAKRNAGDFVGAFNTEVSSLARSGSRGGGGSSVAGSSAASVVADAEQLAQDWDTYLRRMYEDGKMSLADYRAYLEARRDSYEIYSDGYQAQTDELARIDKEEQDRKDAAVQAQIERDRKMAQSVADAQDAQDDRMEAMFETGDLSAADYKAYLQTRLNAQEKYSDEWMVNWRKIQRLEADEQKAADDAAAAEQKRLDDEQKAKDDAAAADAKRRDDERRLADEDLARAANRAIVAANIGGATYATINTLADPNAVVNAIQRYERRNGAGWRS